MLASDLNQAVESSHVYCNYLSFSFASDDVGLGTSILLYICKLLVSKYLPKYLSIYIYFVAVLPHIKRRC